MRDDFVALTNPHKEWTQALVLVQDSTEMLSSSILTFRKAPPHFKLAIT